jgi:hypothetical protein
MVRMRRLYHRFTDEELLNILRLAAEVWCTRHRRKKCFSFIAPSSQALANWPAALPVSGTLSQKRKWSHTNEKDEDSYAHFSNRACSFFLVIRKPSMEL